MQFGWSEDELQNEASAPSVVKRFEIVGLHGYRNVGLHLDLSRFSAAPSARLSHFPFKSDGAFPAQC